MATRTAEDKEIAREARGFKRDLGHTYLLLGALVLLMMLLAPLFNRYLESYQAVVTVAPRDGEAEVILQNSRVVTRAVSQEAVQVGDYLRKEPLRWHPEPIARDDLQDLEEVDDPGLQPPVALPRYFERYMSAWSGVVTRLDIRTLPTTGAGMGEAKDARTMTLALDQGGERTLPVPEAIAPQVRVGSRLEKQARTWTPVVTGQAPTGRADR